MKKITLLFLLVSSFAFSQFTSEASGLTFLGSERTDILLDQVEDGANTIVSCTNTPEAATVLCADDFTLTENTRIDALTIRGTVNNGLAANITGWDLYIFSDNGGSPGQDPNNLAGAPLILQNVNGDGITIVDDGVTAVDVEFNIQTLSEGFELVAGTYWLSVGPIMNITDITDNTAAGQRYNWDSSADANGSEPHLIDVTDVFGAGLTTYTPFSTIGVAVSALSFSLEGEELLSVGDNLLANNISVFPNPTSGDLNINFARSFETLNVDILNVNGQKVLSQEMEGVGSNTLATSRLANGVYFAQISSDQGSTTIKFIKN